VSHPLSYGWQTGTPKALLLLLQMLLLLLQQKLLVLQL